MRLQALSPLTKYDLPAWGIYGLIAAGLIVMDVVYKAYHKNASIPAFTAVVAMLFCCLYNQGVLAGILIARSITLDFGKREEDALENSNV